MSDIIYRHFCNKTTADEEKLLAAWCLNTQNHKLFHELKEAENFYDGVTNMLDIPVEGPLKNVKRKMHRTRAIKVLQCITAVAAIMLVFIFSPIFNSEETTGENITPTQHGNINNNTAIATLVTTGGDILYLENSVKQQPINKIKSKASPKAAENTFNSLTTSKQGNIRITLYDSTIVWLNAKSELKYANSFIDGKRIVYLTGEAFFKVKPDKQHPFIVHTNAAHVNVLGTSFNVDTKDSSCITTLVEGHVRMHNNTKDSVEIYQGQQVTMADGKIDLKKVDTRYYTCWMDNLFAFRATELKHIIQVLEEWYDLDFYFEDKELENILFTTTLERSSDITEILEILSKAGEFTYKIDNNKIKLMNQ